MRIPAIAAALICAPLLVAPAYAQNDGATSDKAASASTKSSSAKSGGAPSRPPPRNKDSNTANVKRAAPVARTRTASARPVRRAQPTGLTLECLKKAGASPDPATGRWIMYVTERDGMSRADMYRLCMAGGDRQKAKNVILQEYQLTPATPTVPAR